ncbi:hypothetical protein PHMEG_00021664 [Phytophthora megakarya]|uniref:Uncharacterized protein n=1 Tax=Phytophthora megakarya TaxID=4795 RepID=A0A225VMZ1_9STRA|nr:hypothetical protein PHMEG_00021664 [Phytophthora megakarya]
MRNAQRGHKYDSITTEYEGDDALNENERIDMEHLRNLAIDEMLLFADEVLLDLDKTQWKLCDALFSRFDHYRSPQANNRFTEIQQKQDKNTQHDRTRWNSCFDVILGFKEHWMFFQHLHSEDDRVQFKDVRNKLSKLKHKEWLAMDCLCALLKPFGTVSTTLRAEEYPTLPLIMSALHAVEGVLENKHIFDCKLDGAGSETYVDEIRVLMVEVHKIMLLSL